MSDRKPLLGKRILVTRAQAQAPKLCNRLAALGATPIMFPTIRIAPMDDSGPLDRAIGALDDYDWVIFTSVNGVAIFWERLAAAGRDAAAFANLQVAAIGPATAQALAARGVQPAFVPDEFVAERIAAGLGDVAGLAILLPRAKIARKALSELLAAQGARVDEIPVYQTLRGRPAANSLAEIENGVDVVTFTSASTVRNFVAMLNGSAKAQLQNTIVACIGPITAQTAQELDLQTDIVAADYTIEGLVTALVSYFSSEVEK